MVPSGQGKHLFVVALGPSLLNGYGPEPQVVLVNFSSVKEGLRYDESCVVEAGEHPFINKKSFVSYRHARLYPAEQIKQRARSNEWQPHSPCSALLMKKILNGFRISRRLPRYFNEILDDLNI